MTGFSIADYAYAGYLDAFAMIVSIVEGGILAIAGLIIGKHNQVMKTKKISSDQSVHKRFHYLCYAIGILLILGVGIGLIINGALVFTNAIDTQMWYAGIAINLIVGGIYLIAGKALQSQVRTIAAMA